MSGYRGYRHYRGRKPGGKTALSVVLVLIILASVLFMILQKQVVYDNTGAPHFTFFGITKEEVLQEDEELKLTIQSKTEKEEVRDLVSEQ